MTQQTIDIHFNPSDETISEELKRTMQWTVAAVQPDVNS
jgi:hypothetical protein